MQYLKYDAYSPKTKFELLSSLEIVIFLKKAVFIIPTHLYMLLHHKLFTFYSEDLGM